MLLARPCPRRSLLSRAWSTSAILAGCLGIATGVAVPLEKILSDRARETVSTPPPLATASAPLIPSHPRSVPRPPVGWEAPDFCLPRLSDDREVRLRDYRGYKPVVLVFGSFG